MNAGQIVYGNWMPIPVERWPIAPDFTISRALTGLWQIADMERDGRSLELARAADAMTAYVDAGLTSFDMADHYGSAEDIAGIYASRVPDARIQLLTKWVPKPGPVTQSDVRAAISRSLERLKRDRLDLLQFHAWNYADPIWLDCLYWLQDLRREGLIGHLGVTNVDTAHLRMVLHSGIEIASNQICFSLLDRRPLHGLTSLCAEHGVSLLGFGTVAGGFLSNRWLGAAEPDWAGLSTWALKKYGRFIRAAGGWEPFQGVLRAADDVARKHGVTIANVASRYVLDQKAVGGVIIGARLGLSEHIDETLKLFSFSLDQADRDHLDAALEHLTPIPGDSGDEYRKPPYLTAAGDLSDHLDTIPPPYTTTKINDHRTMALSGTIWEDQAGYSRAVRVGSHIFVSGTTATHRDKLIGGADSESQANFCIDKIEGALQSLGGRLEHVVRTRVYVNRLSDWQGVARAHGRRFGVIKPANTLVQSGLVGDQYLVEIEADAEITD